MSDALGAGEIRVIKSHDEEVDEEVLTVRRLAVSEHHQLKGLVFFGKLGCCFEG